MAEKDAQNGYGSTTIPANISPESDVRPQMHTDDKPDKGFNLEIDGYLRVKSDNDQISGQEQTASGKNKYPHKSRKNPLKSQARETYAAIDLGTNNCRLLIVEPQGNSFKVIDSFSRIVRLGEGLESSNKLSADAMQRTIEALRVCATKIRRHRVRWMRCVATEACRRAENGQAFINQIEKSTRLRFEIIDGKDEAELAAVGCGALFDRQFPHAIVFDIGGGSTEITCLSLKKGRYERQDMISLPLGVVRLSEKYDGKNMSQEIYTQIRDEAEKKIRAFAEKQTFHADNLNDMQLIGTSGTVTTLAAIHKGLKKYNRNIVDGAVMKRGEVFAVIQSLMNMSHEERQNNNCIGKERADLVLSGCAVLEAIIRVWPLESLKIADRGIREGILLRLIRKTRRRQKIRRAIKFRGAS
ncbi:MAG: Ppx/GppA phosphatase family protein [Pseudomonadota bacterium]|nr:Ppx/GppA phosphatase family protein [Pseudomonadota bacterium]